MLRWPCIAALTFIAGCELSTDIDPLGPPATVERDRSRICGCPGAAAYQLQSLDPDEPVSTIYYETIDGTTFARGPVRIAAGGVYPLGCSLQPDPPAPNACSQAVSYSVPDKYTFTTTRDQQLVANELLITNKTLDCRVECAEQRGHWPYCLRMKEDSDFAMQFGQQLGGLHEKLLDERTTSVGYDELLATFNVQDSTCERGNITLGADGAENDGTTFCELSLSLEPISGGTKAVSLFIQPDLASSIDRSTGNEVTMLFADASSSPILQYKEPNFDRFFGGVVKAIFASKDSMILEGPNACTRVPFGAK